MADDDRSNMPMFLRRVLKAPHDRLATDSGSARLISAPSSAAAMREDADIEEAGMRAAQFLRRTVRDPDKGRLVIECLCPLVGHAAALVELRTCALQLFAIQAPRSGAAPKLTRIRFVPAEVPRDISFSPARAAENKSRPVAAFLPDEPVIPVLIARGIGFRNLQLTALRSVSAILTLNCAQSRAFAPSACAIGRILKVVEPNHPLVEPAVLTAWPQWVDVILNGIRRDALLADSQKLSLSGHQG